MNGILCAYLRATDPSAPSVETTALQPPSMASFTMFSGSKYAGIRRERRAGRMLDALVHGQDRDVAGATQAARVVHGLEAGQHARRPIRERHDPIVEVRPRQMQGLLRDRLAHVLEQAGVVPENLFEPAEARHTPFNPAD